MNIIVTRRSAAGPTHADALLCRALVYVHLNDLEGALTEIRAAEELYPDSAYVQSIAKLMEGRKGN